MLEIDDVQHSIIQLGLFTKLKLKQKYEQDFVGGDF